ncbi:hypothetical protein DITRI_Ditri08aG0112700 [Diplodiscus trichospermus]
MGNVSFIFLLLLFIVHASGNIVSQEMKDAAPVIFDGINVLQFLKQQTEDVKHAHGENHDIKHAHAHVHAGSSSDAGITVFFRIKDLKFGKKLPIFFPHVDPAKSFHFIPRKQADSIPFSTKAFTYLLDFFSIPKGSPQADAMKETLTSCEMKGDDEEIKYCATSIDSLLEFASNIFGSDSSFKILRTPLTKESTPVFQNYTVLDWKEQAAPMVIACHNLAYPYAVYFCHSQKAETKVFMVSLEGDNGDRVDAVTVCHMDTSLWDPNHLSFRLLKVKPGTSEICHFFPSDDLVMVPELTAV